MHKKSISTLERDVLIQALVTALLVTFGVPVFIFVLSYNELIINLDFKAKIKSSALTNLVAHNSTTWMLAENRVQGIISREPVPLEKEYVQVLGDSGELITSSGLKSEWPNVTRSYPVFDIDRPVGIISISNSLKPLLFNLIMNLALCGLLGVAIYLVVKTLPIKALNKALDALHRKKERAETTLFSIGDAVITADSDEVIDYVNPMAEKLFGLPAPKLNGKTLREVVKLRDGKNFALQCNLIDRVIKTKLVVLCHDNVELMRADGTPIAVEVRVSPICDRGGKISGVVMVVSDVSESRKILQLRSWEATHDALTGLLNRREFERRVGLAISECHALGRSSVLCYMDLDRFKIINDTFGHNAGDELLIQLSNLVGQRIRETDSLARLGGDEFGLLLEGCEAKRAILIAEEIATAVREHPSSGKRRSPTWE